MGKAITTITRVDIENKILEMAKAELFERHPQWSNKKLTRKALEQLACELPYVDVSVLTGTVFAVYAVKNGCRYESLVLADIGCYRVACPPNKLISLLLYICLKIHFLSTLHAVLIRIFDDKNMYSLPFVTRSYTLIPLGATKSPSTSWVNPLYIESFIKEGHRAFLSYSFGLTLECELQTDRAIIKRMRQAFEVFAVYTRDHTASGVVCPQSLKSFLNIHRSGLVERALQGVMMADLPKKDYVITRRVFFAEKYEAAEGNLERLFREL